MSTWFWVVIVVVVILLIIWYLASKEKTGEVQKRESEMPKTGFSQEESEGEETPQGGQGSSPEEEKPQE